METYVTLLMIPLHIFSDESLEDLLKSLEKNSMLAIRWFENNYMKLNTDKCHLIVSCYKHEQVWTNVGKDLIWESNVVKLLVITIDRDLKLSALSRMAKLLSFSKRRTLFKAFVESHFKYYPLFGCSILDVRTTKLIRNIREPLELLKTTKFQPLINYLLRTNFLRSTSKYWKTLNLWYQRILSLKVKTP